MKKYGRGLACMWYGIGKTGVPNPSYIRIELTGNGIVNVYTGAADIGQGSSTVLTQIAAEVLQLPLDKVKLINADTAITPDSGVSSASRQTFVTGNAARLAAEKLKEKILGTVAEMYGVKIDAVSYFDQHLGLNINGQEITMRDLVQWCKQKGRTLVAESTYSPPTIELDGETGQGAPYATYTFGTQIAEVEVDTITGIVKVLRLSAIHDVGKAINPVMAEGQIEGGCIMGLGYGLFEDYDHIKVKRGFADYIIPTSTDVPDIETILVEDYEPEGPFGAKGLGEAPTVATAAAIANAVADALGIRIFSLPITPERVLQAIEDNENRKVDVIAQSMASKGCDTYEKL